MSKARHDASPRHARIAGGNATTHCLRLDRHGARPRGRGGRPPVLACCIRPVAAVRAEARGLITTSGLCRARVHNLPEGTPCPDQPRLSPEQLNGGSGGVPTRSVYSAMKQPSSVWPVPFRLSKIDERPCRRCSLLLDTLRTFSDSAICQTVFRGRGTMQPVSLRSIPPITHAGTRPFQWMEVLRETGRKLLTVRLHRS
jgi:hypothetical protein